MRHAEVTQTPAQAGDNVLPAAEGVEVIGRIHSMDAHTLKHKQRKDWGNEQCAQHQHTLEKVRPAHGRKTAQEGIADDDDGGKIQRRRLVHTGHSVKEGAACLHTGGSVHGVSHQEYHRADDLQGLRFGQEPVSQVLGDGDGVIGHNGEPPQPGCLHEPADDVANGQTHRDPHLPHAQGIDRGRQTHEYPRAHVGGACGQSRDPGTHLTAAQEICLLAAGAILKEEIHPDGQHKDQINHKHNNFADFHSFHS